MEIKVKPSGPLRGRITIPGDKSISHRAIILGSIAKGTTTIKGFLEGQDCLNTISCLRNLGVQITKTLDNNYSVAGKGLKGLEEPTKILDVGNSGTTIRLLAGLLSGQPFFSILTGDESIRKRPMDRVIKPLQKMGSCMHGRKNNTLAPLAIRGGSLKGMEYLSSVASAQVKSAILLAALNAEGITMVKEPLPSRDHTERMLKAFGAKITVEEKTVYLEPGLSLQAQDILIPGDISSAAFFIVAATIIPESELLIENVGINPTRSGILKALEAMGASIDVLNQREHIGEPVADLLVKYAPLQGINVHPDWIPSLIDEIPILAVAASVASGETRITNAGELRVKETDRITSTGKEFAKMGVNIHELPDGMVIPGNSKPIGAEVLSHGDHRLAMALTILALTAQGSSVVLDGGVADISFPGFQQLLQSLIQE